MQPERLRQATRDHAQRQGADRRQVSRQILAVRHPRQLQAPADREQRPGRLLAQRDPQPVLLPPAPHRPVPALLSRRHGPAVDAAPAAARLGGAARAVDRAVEEDRHGAAHPAHAHALLRPPLHLLPVRVHRGILCMHDFPVCLLNPAFRGFQNPINGLFFEVTVHTTRRNTIRYDTRCYFNVRSKADTSRLNLRRTEPTTKECKTEKN